MEQAKEGVGGYVEFFDKNNAGSVDLGKKRFWMFWGNFGRFYISSTFLLLRQESFPASSLDNRTVDMRITLPSSARCYLKLLLGPPWTPYHHHALSALAPSSTTPSSPSLTIQLKTRNSAPSPPPPVSAEMSSTFSASSPNPLLFVPTPTQASYSAPQWGASSLRGIFPAEIPQALSYSLFLVMLPAT